MEKDYLNESVISLKGIGEKTVKLFNKCGIFTVNDLLHYYPKDYDLFEKPKNITDIVPGEVCAIRCLVRGNTMTKRIRSLSITAFEAEDITGKIKITYFNAPFITKGITKGIYIVFRGRTTKKGNYVYMEQPRIYKTSEYELLQDTMQPKYALVKGLTNNMIIKAMNNAISYTPYLEETLDEETLHNSGVLSISTSIRHIHFPKNKEDYIKARERIAFEEFFLFIMKLHLIKRADKKLLNPNKMIEVADTNRLIEELPYELTNAQKDAWKDIENDLTSDAVMNRLVQGDVGSGKTILAFLALLMTAANGYQGAIMAPTEVLARQHFDSFSEMASKYKLPVTPVLLTGSLTAKDKREKKDLIKNGFYNCIIGTNALIQDSVSYKNLALVVTDEQHRFGVRQRENLAGKGDGTHILAMSATPIPRTLAIILYGDLHISLVKDVPKGRIPIKNCVVGTNSRSASYKFIEKEIAKKHQAYIICPMVESGDSDTMENVTDYKQKLCAELGSSIRVEMLHGKMKGSLKEAIMDEFAKGNIDVLVSTTVIEVGINVPNATVMMIENADHFGLAQLHQLRGRVGRGSSQSYCIFLNSSDKEDAAKRLEILNNSNDGFEIAAKDLEQRGPGDIFGIRQSGDLNFNIGDIYQDSELIKLASSLADKALDDNFDFYKTRMTSEIFY